MHVVDVSCLLAFFFFKQKTAYEMRISDWSSDVCSSDLDREQARRVGIVGLVERMPEAGQRPLRAQIVARDPGAKSLGIGRFDALCEDRRAPFHRPDADRKSVV